jgi:nucleoid DNA-binding protein
MKSNKTRPTINKVSLSLNQLESEQKRKDSQVLIDLISKITNEVPVIWGTSINGFGSYQYKYKSGREGDWFLTGFSPRKNAMSTYLMCDLEHKDLNFDGLGKYKKSQGCLYLKKTMILI